MSQVNQLYASRQNEVGQVQRLADFKVGNVDVDALRQRSSGAEHVYAGQVTRQLAAAYFHAYAAVFVKEVQRDVRFDFGSFAYAQEVSVPDQGFGWVTLQRLQNDLFVLPSIFKVMMLL